MDDLEDLEPTPAPAPSADRPLLGLTILVVEDSRFACEAMRLLCLRSGARIRRADCLRSARRHLRVYRPSVVVVDLGLPDGMEDLAYLKTLALVLEELRDRITPDIVFYNAGVDVHRDDRLGRLSLTDHGIEQRERMVFAHFRQRGIPVCGVIGGGYSKDIEAIALRHVILHRVASEFVF